MVALDISITLAQIYRKIKFASSAEVEKKDEKVDAKNKAANASAEGRT